MMILCGMAEGLIFDFFRIIRKKIPKTFLCTGMSDIFFWIISTICFFGTVWNVTEGYLRGYMFVGVFLGLVFYFLLLSKTIIWLFTAVFKFFLTIFKLIFKILLTPFVFLYKMLLGSFIGFWKNLFVCPKKINLRKLGNKRNDKKTK